MEDRYIISGLLLVIGFFLRSLVKNISEAKEGINELNQSLTKHIERQSHIEAEVAILRDRYHKTRSSINANDIKIEQLRTRLTSLEGKA